MKPKFMMKQKLKNVALWCKIAKNLAKCFIYEARIKWCVFWTLHYANQVYLCEPSFQALAPSSPSHWSLLQTPPSWSPPAVRRARWSSSTGSRGHLMVIIYLLSTCAVLTATGDHVTTPGMETLWRCWYLPPPGHLTCRHTTTALCFLPG